MARAAKSVLHRRNASERHHDQAARTVLAISGALFSLIGAVLVVGGYLSINGSAFHIFAGFMLIASGVLVARRRRAGAWPYMLAFVCTVCWSLRNIDDGSPLQQRLVGPTLLLVMMAVLMPLLCRWRPRQAVAVFTLLIGLTIGLGISSLPEGPLAHQTAAVTHFLDAETKGALQ
jgi:glucose dehydrogenase